MRYTGKKGANTPSVAAGCYVDQVILDVSKPQSMETCSPFHTFEIQIRLRRRTLFPLDTFSGRRVNLLMRRFLAFHSGYIRYASCPGYHLSSRQNGFPHPLAILSPLPVNVYVDFIQSLCHA